MRILFADSISEQYLEPLRRLGHEVEVAPTLGAEELPARVQGIDVLGVRSTKVTGETIEAADRLGLIVRAGAGTDNIDKAAASGAGVYVCNVPGRNAVAVAELTMGLLIAIDRRIAENVADLREAVWNKREYSRADGLLGQTMAIIGLGEIGLAVAERARAFGIVVTAERRPGRTAETEVRIRSLGIRLVDSRDELLRQADIVSLHVPRSEGTRHLVDAEFLALMPEGSILLNTSRGDVVDETALLDALNNRGLRAGLDVWDDEPAAGSGDFVSTLAQHPHVVGSHHIGASTEQAQQSVAEGTVEVIQAYLDGTVINCVNVDRGATGTCYLTVRHRDRVGVLAQVFGVLRANGLNVQQMQNEIFTGGRAAVATIGIGGEAGDEVISQLMAIDDVLAAASIPSEQTP